MNSVKVMGSNGDESSLPRKILVQLVLKCYEGVVALFVEFDVPQYCACDIRSNLLRLRID